MAASEAKARTNSSALGTVARKFDAYYTWINEGHAPASIAREVSGTDATTFTNEQRVIVAVERNTARARTEKGEPSASAGQKFRVMALSESELFADEYASAMAATNTSLGGTVSFSVLETASPNTTRDGESDFNAKPWVADPTSSRLGANEGLVVAVIDHGCPFVHPNFRVHDADGTIRKGTRVKLIWDQDSNRSPVPPKGWSPPSMTRDADMRSVWAAFVGSSNYWNTRVVPYGAVLMPNEVLKSPFDTKDESVAYAESKYMSTHHEWTHGGHVMDIACGWPNPLDRAATQPDAAANAEIVFVQLPRDTIADTSGSAMTVHVLAALQFIMDNVDQSARLVVNLSYGTFAGPHDGSSFLERAMDSLVASRPRMQIVLPAGNSYNEACHAVFRLSSQKKSESAFVEVLADNPRDTFIELWWCGDASVSVTLTPPFGAPLVLSNGESSASRAGDVNRIGVKAMLVRRMNASTSPSGAKNHMVLVAIAPTFWLGGDVGAIDVKPRNTAPYGLWQLAVESVDAGNHAPLEVHAYIERGDLVTQPTHVQTQPRFLVDPTENPRDDYPASQPVTKRGTLNSYATGRNTIVVGARFGDDVNRLSDYTSVGPGRNGERSFGPDRSAIGDESHELRGVLATRTIGSGVVRLNGTSVAAPQVTRALLNGLSPYAALGVQCPISSAEHGLPLTKIDWA